MVIDIHKTIISNPISRNLLKPWGSFAKPNSLRSKLFNKYTDPGNPIEKQVDFHPYTGQIYKVHDPPLSNNDRCSMFHDIAYTVAQNVGKNPKDVKNRKLQADDKWLDCFKVRTPYDALAYSAIKTKKTLGLGNNFTMEDLSQELNKPTIQKFQRQMRRLIAASWNRQALDFSEFTNFYLIIAYHDTITTTYTVQSTYIANNYELSQSFSSKKCTNFVL